jgi:hypothetical protein
MKKNRIRNQASSNGFKSPGLNRKVIIFFIVIMVINFNHNWRVSGENTTRNFQYAAWQILTKDSTIFSQVKNSDIFVSANQNDAFETNAGSFYANTGIRLAYLFNTTSIFPNFTECTIDSDCKLSGIREKSIATLPNLTRGTYVPTRADKSRKDDWVGINSKPGALDSNNIWSFDIFLLTPTTYFSYLAPFVDDEVNAKIDFLKLRVVTITSKSSNEFGPSIAKVCLEQIAEPKIESGMLMTEWKVPLNPVDPSGNSILPRDSIDLREIQVGTCAIK